MDRNEVSIAFEILLEEIETVVNSLSEDGAKAFKARDYDGARQLIEDATRLTDFHEKVKTLQEDWQTLFAPKAPTRKKRRRKAGKRLRRGLRTPQHAFRKPILEVLVELGGSAASHEVVDAVGKKMKGTLNQYDRQRLQNDPTHRVRWRNTAEWCRNRMAREGLLKADSPRGTWEISEKGRKALERMS